MFIDLFIDLSEHVYSCFCTMHRYCCCRPVGSSNIGALCIQLYIQSQDCSWRWASLSPETCRADLKRSTNGICCILLVTHIAACWCGENWIWICTPLDKERFSANSRQDLYNQRIPLELLHLFVYSFLHSFIHPSIHSSIHQSIHSFSSLTTRPQPLRNRLLPTVQSSAFSFNFHCHLFSSRSYTSCLHLFPPLPVTFMFPLLLFSSKRSLIHNSNLFGSFIIHI